MAEDSGEDIATLVQGFATHIKSLKSPETKEATIRQNYIDKFWRHLGWDVGDHAQRGPAESEVIIEKNVETAEAGGLRSRRPDYLFRVGGAPRFVVEAKKPSVQIDTDQKAIYQAKQYAWNSTIPFAILTDFEQFRLYDTTLKPIFNEPGRGLVADFSLEFGDYVTQWDVLVATFGRDAVLGNSLDRLLATVKKLKAGRRVRSVDRTLFDLKGSEPVDIAFLSFLDIHRRHLAADIYKQNKSHFPDAATHHGAARLTEAVQRIMDRLVFMRACEDRGVIVYGSLRDTLERVGTEGGELYDSLGASFIDMNVRYNGYLYHPHFSTELKVDGNVLADFIRTLYPPDGPWDFAAIGDDILGTVYERFLGNVVTVQDGLVAITEKPEVRHANGVHYTPRFIVDTIIRRVIGPKLAGKTPAQVLNVKILDLSCGSGSFVVAPLQYLFDYCLAAITAKPALAEVEMPDIASGPAGRKRKKKSAIAFQGADGLWYLAPDFRAALLTNCIHGVDIDQQAVEVTVMSLYLKMLESKLPDGWATLWVEKQLLPPLANNIHCGNSLIDSVDFDAYVTETHGGLFPMNDDVRFRINRFDWTSRTRGFGRLMDSEATEKTGRGGFDCIIGNPPYIRVQELNKWAPEECEFYKWNYKSAEKGNYDIYVVFTEKGLSLLNENGLLGFIMPHKFWQAKYGEGLRELIGNGRNLKSLVDFGDQQVFTSATTYTAVHILSRAPNTKSVDYAKIGELIDGRAQCSDIDAGKSAQGSARFKARRPEGIGPWVFSNATVAKWMDAVRGDHKTLGAITSKIAQGLVSGCDPAFYVERNGNDYFSEQTGRTHAIERELMHPLLKGSVHIRRWAMDATRLCVLFPYELAGEAWKLIPPDRMKKKYPKAFAYLSDCRTQLEEREKKETKNEMGEAITAIDGKPVFDRPFKGPDFYRFSRPQNFEVMPLPKLLVPAMAQRGEYAIDKAGAYYYVGSGGGGGGAHAILPNVDVSLEYLCGLLNSTCLDTFLHHVTTPFHSGWFAYSKGYIAQIPIKLPETPAEKKLAARITESVRLIMDAKLKLRSGSPGNKSPGLSDRERGSLESEVEAHERRIDEAVFALYGVDGLPG